MTQEQAYSDILLEMVSPLDRKTYVIHKVFTAGCTHTEMCSQPQENLQAPQEFPFALFTQAELLLNLV